MQAIAWALAAGATGIAGALIATFFYISPTVGETLAIIAFVTVSLGGFGSVPGALVAGLIIGVDRGAVGLSDRRRSTRTSSFTRCSCSCLWIRPQGLMGKA